MNKTYRSIYSEKLGTWVAASESTKSRGKKSQGLIANAAVAMLLIGGAAGVSAQSVGTGSASTSGTAISGNCAPTSANPANAFKQASEGGSPIAMGCNSSAIGGAAISIGFNSSAGSIIAGGAADTSSNIAIGNGAVARSPQSGLGDQVAIGGGRRQRGLTQLRWADRRLLWLTTPSRSEATEEVSIRHRQVLLQLVWGQ